jgi:hypothetical protein
MKAYLSIDLDFWNDAEFPEHFFNKLLATGLPIYVVNDHEHLLPHVKQFNFDTLINIDYHSDIADRSFSGGQFRNVALSCGTWVNHVKGHDKHYIWSYPCLECYYHGRGTCHADRDPFDCENFEGWSQITHRYVYFPRYSDVVAIGIATSEPDYTEDYIACPFYEWLRKQRRYRRIKLHPKIKTRLEKIQWELFEEEGRSHVLARFACQGLITFDELEESVVDQDGLVYEVNKMRRLGYRKMRAACARAFKRVSGKTVTQYLAKHF